SGGGCGYRFAVPSSVPMGAACGRRRMKLAAPYFSSPLPGAEADHEYSSGGSPDVRAARKLRMRFFTGSLGGTVTRALPIAIAPTNRSCVIQGGCGIIL